VLEPASLEPQPAGGEALAAAERVYREHSQRYFILDAALPRAPWWLLPGVGDASVTFQTRRHGELTFTTSSSEAEDVSLFDRARRRQILLYPSGGREPRYSEDAGRIYDLLHLDLQARFEPVRRFLSGEARVQLRLLQPASTVRLRLDDDFKVESVTSGEGVRHLFFRVRDQDSLMVSLGALAGGTEEVTLTVRYSGVHEPAPVEHEVLQVSRVLESPEESVQIEQVLVYTNRTAWYPRPSLDDHATGSFRFDTPMGLSVVTGGARTAARVEGQRTLVEYRQDRPGKYVTAAIGRFYETGERDAEGLHLRAFGLSVTKNEAGELLERASRILAFFSAQFGPCPYPELNLLLIEGEAPGGHAPPGMVLLQRRPPLLRRALRDDPASFPDEPDFFLAHELAHQWFGHGVSGANYRERWLSEGFAQYAAALWARERGGETAFRKVLERFSRWSFRYDVEGPIHLGYRVGHLKGDAQAYRAVVYDKAAYVLHMLRGVIGEEAFKQGIRSYQEAHRFSKAGTDDLREALESASGQDLSAYFRSWVFGTGLPRLTYRSRVEGAPSGYRVALDVEAETLPGPVPVQATLTQEAGVVVDTVRVPPGSSHHQLEAKARPRRVELNADFGLLARVDGK
jgi:aminopeptidase N